MVIPVIEKASRKGNRGDNLTEKERKGMKVLRERKNIVIQLVDKGGAITVMSKEWYKGEMKEKIVEGYQT
jgi:hypothetical protein